MKIVVDTNVVISGTFFGGAPRRVVEAIGKKEIKAYQVSKRVGYLDCVLLDNGRIAISGEAALVAVTEIVAELK